MTKNEEILAIANEIANKGNKPSVALIKTKLSSPTPLPMIIATLKTWQHQPEKTRDNLESAPKKVAKTVPNKDLEYLIDKAITNAIDPLIKEIASLKKEIIALKKD